MLDIKLRKGCPVGWSKRHGQKIKIGTLVLQGNILAVAFDMGFKKIVNFFRNVNVFHCPRE